VVAAGVTREEHRAMVKYVNEMELVSARRVGDPAPAASLSTCSVSCGG
jgi:hypothetical protein